MPVKLSNYMKNLSMDFNDGSFVGPFSALVKSILQGRAFNTEMPEKKSERFLYHIASGFDMLLLMALIGLGIMAVYTVINLIGG